MQFGMNLIFNDDLNANKSPNYPIDQQLDTNEGMRSVRASN